MKRDRYKIFSPGNIASLQLSNRLVRSATWDPCLFKNRRMTLEVLSLYKELALGGVGLIITGGFPVIEERQSPNSSGNWLFTYSELRVDGIEQMNEVVKGVNPECKIVAQLENGAINARPSTIQSPFSRTTLRELTEDEISDIIDCFVEGIRDIQKSGFDGVQLHAAHGGLLSRFLSPYTNRRNDAYGGSASKRARIIQEIVSEARRTVRDFPIMIKINGTDYVPNGIDLKLSPEIAYEIEKCGVDAMEVSGGMWDCLARPEEDLGFRPVPAPESHTRIHTPAKQSYFLKYVENLNLRIPIILVGGNRNIERLEEIIQQSKVDFIALSRPLIREPDLPNRWLKGRGKATTNCISCNSCIYDMHIHPRQSEPGLVTCVHQNDKNLHRDAQQWLSSWVERNFKV